MPGQSATGGVLAKGLSVRITTVLLSVSFLSLSQLFCCIDSGNSAASASAEAFVIRYCIHHNGTTEPSYLTETNLDIYSDGTVLYRYASCRPSGNSTKNMSSQLPSALMDELLNTLVYGEFSVLDRTMYEDSGWSMLSVNHTERVSIETPNDVSSVLFRGHSIMGAIPNSYALLSNIMRLVTGVFPDMPNVALDIFVWEPLEPGPIASITAHLTNHGSELIYDSALCNTSWPLFIVSTDGSTVVDLQGSVFPSCVMEFAPFTTRDFGPWLWNRSDIAPGRYVIMSRVVVWDCEIGDITPNLTWTPYNGQLGPEDDLGPPCLVLVGLSIVIGVVAVLVSAFYLRRRSHRRWNEGD